MDGNSKDLSRGSVRPQAIYEAYLRQKRKESWWVHLTQIAILALFIGGWELAGRMKWIDVLLFSYPTKVAIMLYSKFADGSILPHIGITVFETIIGFLLGTFAGVAIATLVWWSPFLARVLDPYFVVLNALPKVALGPLFIVGLGSGIVSIVATILSITVIITTLVVYTSFKEVDPNYIKVVKIFGANRGQIFRKVILPACYPTIVSTLKVNVGLAWVGVIVGEFLVSEMGLGYLIIYGFQVFNFTLVIGSLVVIAVVATLMYQGVALFEARVIKKK